MYPEILIIPMREELTRAGAQELRTAADVDAALADRNGTALVVVNSVCGCAAGKMRPGVRRALQSASRPDRVYTVFAGQDKEATERAACDLARATEVGYVAGRDQHKKNTSPGELGRWYVLQDDQV